MMNEFLIDYQRELLGSAITILVFIVLRFIAVKAIKGIGRKGNLSKGRTTLIIKYFSIGFLTLGIVALILIWGVNIKELGLIFSSAFAIIGVALFAQWSILSNITAGIILFLSFPFKIGDRIKILDKELETEDVFTIEDIRVYYIYLKKSNGDMVTFPNILMLQKAVTLVYSDGQKNSG